MTVLLLVGGFICLGAGIAAPHGNVAASIAGLALVLIAISRTQHQ